MAVHYRAIPIIMTNKVVEGNDIIISFNGKNYRGFYISYNTRDSGIYGCPTTALVLGQMQKFFILNGNHLSNYEKLVEYGFYKCYDYFMNHISQINSFSDSPQKIMWD